MLKLFAIILAMILFYGVITYADARIAVDTRNNSKLNWFVSSSVGYQMSGIKSEDFVRSNYSPLFNFSIGKWFSPELALQFGYRGMYFNMISDYVRHHYNFFFGDVIFDLNNLVLRQKKETIYKVLLHLGSGVFYNFHYGQPNICASLGLSNNLHLDDNLMLKFDISAIMGWDIYQGDEDILPGLSIGLTYLF